MDIRRVFDKDPRHRLMAKLTTLGVPARDRTNGLRIVRKDRPM